MKTGWDFQAFNSHRGEPGPIAGGEALKQFFPIYKQSSPNSHFDVPQACWRKSICEKVSLEVLFRYGSGILS